MAGQQADLLVLSEQEYRLAGQNGLLKPLDALMQSENFDLEKLAPSVIQLM